MTARVPDPNDVAAYDAALDEITVGGAQPLAAPIEVRDYDPEWPRLYEREEARIRSILGERVRRIEHVGSTSVPGLPAKPQIDIVLEVPDSSDEPSYCRRPGGGRLPAADPRARLVRARVLKGPDTNVNLHVFTGAATRSTA